MKQVSHGAIPNAFIGLRQRRMPSATERDDLKHPAQYEELQHE